MKPLALIQMTLFVASCASPSPPLPDGPWRPRPPPDIDVALKKLGPVIDPPATGALYRPLQQREPYAGVQVTRSVAYGPDPRHLLDVFTPAAAGPARPVLVFVHGGAFVGGDRRTGDSPSTTTSCCGPWRTAWSA